MAKKKKGRKNEGSTERSKKQARKKNKQSILSSDRSRKKQDKVALLKLTQAFAKQMDVNDDHHPDTTLFDTEHANVRDRMAAKKMGSIKNDTGKRLTFAPATFSLTKSTRQLLEETVQGLGGFGVSTPSTQQIQPQRAFMTIPVPPPNTPIVSKNPFSSLDTDDTVAEPPTLTFQPATFDASMDPDL